MTTLQTTDLRVEIVLPPLFNWFRDSLDEMFRQRWRIFGERMRWRVAGLNGRERDAFDDAGPIYLLCRDRAGRLLGSQRLLPTSGPNMLSDVFAPMLGMTDPPCSPAIWESSRFTVEVNPRGRRSVSCVNKATSALFCAALELGLFFGWEGIVAVYDERMRRVMDQCGGAGTPIAPAGTVDGVSTLVGLWPVNEARLDRIRRRAGLPASVLATPLPDPAPSSNLTMAGT